MSILTVTPLKGSKLTAPITVGAHLRVLEDGDPIPANHHVWRFLTADDGDKRIVWDPTDFTQMREAKEMYDNCLREGLVPYICNEDGSVSNDVMDWFDPRSGEVLFREVVVIPQRLVQGG